METPFVRYILLTLARIGDLVLRVRRGGLGCRRELGGLPPRVPLPRVRRRSRDRRRRGLARSPLRPKAQTAGRGSRRWDSWTNSSKLHSPPCPSRSPSIDVKAQYAPLIPQIKAAIDEVLEGGQFVFGPNVERLRGGGGALPRRSRDDRRRERHGRARPRPERARDRRGRRGHLPGLHVLRDRRGDRARRRDAGVRGHRPADAEPRSGTCRRTHHGPHTKAIMPVHLFGRPAPLAELAAARPAADRGRGAGVRLARDRGSRHRVDLQLLSRRRTCSASGTAASSRSNDGELAERDPHASLPRVEGEAHLRVHRDELEAGRDPGRRAADLPARARRLDRASPRGGRALPRARPRRHL